MSDRWRKSTCIFSCSSKPLENISLKRSRHKSQLTILAIATLQKSNSDRTISELGFERNCCNPDFSCLNIRHIILHLLTNNFLKRHHGRDRLFLILAE
jgi:hypothetical protein